MKQTIWTITALIALGSCSSPELARGVLTDQGFTDVTIDGYAWTGCSESDSTHTAFSATGPTGRHVHGVVCCGFTSWGKGCTVRIVR